MNTHSHQAWWRSINTRLTVAAYLIDHYTSIHPHTQLHISLISQRFAMESSSSKLAVSWYTLFFSHPSIPLHETSTSNVDVSLLCYMVILTPLGVNSSFYVCILPLETRFIFPLRPCSGNPLLKWIREDWPGFERIWFTRDLIPLNLLQSTPNRWMEPHCTSYFNQVKGIM